jgi:hypothetical protein
MFKLKIDQYKGLHGFLIEIPNQFVIPTFGLIVFFIIGLILVVFIGR